MDIGYDPAPNGLLAIADSAPVVGLIRNPATVLSRVLLTYTNLPVGSTVTDSGSVPAANGLPAIGVSAPVDVFIEKAEMLFANSFAT